MSDSEITRECNYMDKIFLDYQEELGDDFTRYSNHCYRLLNYLQLMELDDNEDYKCRILLPFHDLGIWTHKTMNYLPPSIELAVAYVKKNNIEIEESEIIGFIGNHHKITKNKITIEEKLRKADLIDLTNGIVPLGLSSRKLKEIRSVFPSLGFQKLIYWKVIKHGIGNITNPFPMLKL